MEQGEYGVWRAEICLGLLDQSPVSHLLYGEWKHGKPLLILGASKQYQESTTGKI